MTETNAVTVGIDGKDFKKRPSSCGKPTPLFDLKIVDEASRTRASACDLCCVLIKTAFPLAQLRPTNDKAPCSVASRVVACHRLG